MWFVRWKRMVGLVSVAVVMSFLSLQFFSSYQSEGEIRDSYLEKAPLGSSLQDVTSFINKQGWTLKYDWHENAITYDKFYPGVRGQHIIGADIGHYWGFPFNCYVDAYWGFDANGRLIDLRVRKMYDGL